MTKRSMMRAKTGACVVVALLIPTLVQADRSANCELLQQHSAVEALGEFFRSMTLKNDRLDQCPEEESERESYRKLQDKYTKERMDDQAFRKSANQIPQESYIGSYTAPTNDGPRMLQMTEGANDRNIVELDTLKNYRSITQ